MPGNRKAAEQVILTYLEKIAPKSGNAEQYKRAFAAMSDKAFEQYIHDIESGAKPLYIIAENFSKAPLSLERNLKIGDELGYSFFQKLWIEGSQDVPSYLTPNEYMVLDLPLRRASQMLRKKISVPKDMQKIDMLTGQPTGESKGAKISFPELQICAAMGLDSCMIELMKYRGGDAGGNRALSDSLSKRGTARLQSLAVHATGVQSTNTLRTFLTCAGLKTNL